MIHIPHECANGCTQTKPRTTILDCPVWRALYEQTEEYKEANHWKYVACELVNDLSMAQSALDQAWHIMKQSSASQEEKNTMEYSFKTSYDLMEGMYKDLDKIPHCGDPMFDKAEAADLKSDPVVYCTDSTCRTSAIDMPDMGATFSYRDPSHPKEDIKFAEATQMVSDSWVISMTEETN